MIRLSQADKIKIDPSFYREKLSVFEIDEQHNVNLVGLEKYLKSWRDREAHLKVAKTQQFNGRT